MPHLRVGVDRALQPHRLLPPLRQHLLRIRHAIQHCVGLRDQLPMLRVHVGRGVDGGRRHVVAQLLDRCPQLCKAGAAGVALLLQLGLAADRIVHLALGLWAETGGRDRGQKKGGRERLISNGLSSREQVSGLEGG